jgi:dCTP deaminase
MYFIIAKRRRLRGVEKGVCMAFWSSQTLESKLAEIVDQPDPNLVDCNAVTLRVGREIYVTPSLEQPAPNVHTKQLLEPEKAFAIPPGQFAFILTEEAITIPPDAMGLISIKATFKLRGLVNIPIPLVPTKSCVT